MTGTLRASTRLWSLAFVIGSAANAADVVQDARLTPTGPLTSDIFTYDLDFDGTTLVGGAPFATISGVQQPGRAFAFERVGGVWKQTALLQPPVKQKNAYFGVSVAVDGDRIAIAAPGEDTPIVDAGAVYLFERGVSTWTQVAKLTAFDAIGTMGFGRSLALRGDRLLVGANGGQDARGEFTGAVYVYERIAGLWTAVDKLTPADGAFADNFGSAVALEDHAALIGGPGVDVVGQGNAGAAYVFTQVDGRWGEVAKLISSQAIAEGAFGLSVSLQGQTAVIGAHAETVEPLALAGAAYIFDAAADRWTETARLTAPDADAADHFGCDVSIRGNAILVGSYLDSNPTGTGSVYLFRRAGTRWSYETKFVAGDSGGILFGWRVAHTGDLAAVGAPFYQTNRGAAYIFHGLSSCAVSGCELGDLNDDCCVNQMDLGLLLSGFGSIYTQQDLGELLRVYDTDCGGC